MEREFREIHENTNFETYEKYTIFEEIKTFNKKPPEYLEDDFDDEDEVKCVGYYDASTLDKSSNENDSLKKHDDVKNSSYDNANDDFDFMI